MSGAAGGAAAAAIAAAKKRKEREEEEKMTSYNKNDLDGWEFKIMRSTFGRFGNQEYFRKVCEEESRAGWELMEKFDNERVRFKRRVDKRGNDQMMDYDPYRTSAGSGRGGAIGILFGILGLIFGALVLFFVIMSAKGYRFEFGEGFMIWVVLAITIVLGLFIVLIKRRRG